MKRYRTLISVLLGLVLLVQGFAVSAAPRASLSSAATAHAEMQMKGDAPCPMMMGEASGKQAPSCCNATCPDMTTCALGHIAAISVFSVALPATAQIHPQFSLVLAVARTSTSLLRPPISLHG